MPEPGGGGDLAAAEPGGANAVASRKTGAPPLVMRQYRQRELPVVVRQVSGGVAALHFPGPEPKDLEVAAGETIPGSTLTVVKVFSRMETGKLNEGAPVEVGVIEVEDSRSGQRAEWVAGRPAAGHEPCRAGGGCNQLGNATWRSRARNSRRKMGASSWFQMCARRSS